MRLPTILSNRFNKHSHFAGNASFFQRKETSSRFGRIFATRKNFFPVVEESRVHHASLSTRGNGEEKEENSGGEKSGEKLGQNANKSRKWKIHSPFRVPS